MLSRKIRGAFSASGIHLSGQSGSPLPRSFVGDQHLRLESVDEIVQLLAPEQGPIPR